MKFLIAAAIIAYILFFFAAVYYSIKFQFSQESNDERGRKLLNTSYAVAFPLVILWWFILFLINEIMDPFTLESYQTAIWFMVTGTYIVHAVTLFSLKKLS